MRPLLSLLLSLVMSDSQKPTSRPRHLREVRRRLAPHQLRLERLEDRTLLSVGWITEFGTSASDSATAVTQDPSGNLYVAGVTNVSFGGTPNYSTYFGLGYSGPSGDSFIRKYDASGNLIWSQQFGLGQPNAATGIAADAAGEYVVGNMPDGVVPGLTDAYLRKYDPSGNVLWTQPLGAGSLVSVAEDASGVFVAGGHAVSMFDTNGNQIWTTQVGFGVYNVAADASSVYVGGFGSGFYGVVSKYDLSGNELWTRQIGAGGVGGGFGLAVDASGVYAGGLTTDTFPGQTSLTAPNGGPAVRQYLVKYDSAGNQLWAQEYGNVYDESPATGNIAVDSSGIYIVGAGFGHPLVQKCDLNGNRLWTIAGQGIDANGSQVSPDIQGYGISAGPSGIFVAGTTLDSIAGQTNAGGFDAILGNISEAPIATIGDAFSSSIAANGGLLSGNSVPEESRVEVDGSASYVAGTYTVAGGDPV